MQQDWVLTFWYLQPPTKKYGMVTALKSKPQPLSWAVLSIKKTGKCLNKQMSTSKIGECLNKQMSAKGSMLFRKN